MFLSFHIYHAFKLQNSSENLAATFIVFAMEIERSHKMSLKPCSQIISNYFNASPRAEFAQNSQPTGHLQFGF